MGENKHTLFEYREDKFHVFHTERFSRNMDYISIDGWS